MKNRDQDILFAPKAFIILGYLAYCACVKLIQEESTPCYLSLMK
jgi:hypothetical protein